MAPSKKIKKSCNPHTELVNKTLLLLHELLLGRFWKNNTGSVKAGNRYVSFGLKGSSDIIGIYHGRMVCLEIKTGTGRQSKDQQLFQKMIEVHGGFYAVVRSEQDVIRICSVLQIGKLAREVRGE